MARQHLPSIETLISSDDERLLTELKLSEVRDQVAHAQQLLDTVEVASLTSEATRSSEGHAAVAPAFAEELARLGCRIVEIASVLSRAQVVTPRSGERLHA